MGSSFLQALDKLLQKCEALEVENKTLKKELESIQKNKPSEIKKMKKTEKKNEKTIKTPPLF